MDHIVNDRDFQLLSADRHTFSVLSRILRGPCSCIRTDHEKLILCYSAAPYPVWIWTPDNASDSEKERAWQLAEQTLPLSDGYRYNLKYELASYFLSRAQQAGLQLRIETNLFAYDCPSPVQPSVPTDGFFYICTAEDAVEAADLIFQFNETINNDSRSREACLLRAQEYISDSAFFFWKNASGETVACCSYKSDDTFGCIGSVYTKPEQRRKHYAQHMVYQATQLIASSGLMPMLYTDADYAASNSCYEKIGYILRGKLCTIAAQ